MHRLQGCGAIPQSPAQVAQPPAHVMPCNDAHHVAISKIVYHDAATSNREQELKHSALTMACKTSAVPRAIAAVAWQKMPGTLQYL